MTHIPTPTPETESFWRGTLRGELLLQRCQQCGLAFFPPRSACPACRSLEVPEFKALGTATLHSFVLNERASEPWSRPQCVALVDLTEGIRLLTCLVDCGNDPAALELGMPLELTFKPLSSLISLPVFRPRARSDPNT